MNNCPSDNTFTQFLEGSLELAAVSELRRHIRQCKSCYRLMASMLELETLEQLDLLPMPSEKMLQRAEQRLMTPAKEQSGSVKKRPLHRFLKGIAAFSWQPNDIFGLPELAPAIADEGASDVCAIRCEWNILKDHGIELPLEQLIAESENAGWYRKGVGTGISYLGNLLEQHGLTVKRIHNATLEDLRREIAFGHLIIAAVDRGEMEASTLDEKRMEELEEQYGPRPDHAVCIFEVFEAASGQSVSLCDPESEGRCFTVDWETFEAAWEDSAHLLISAWK